MKPAYIDMKYVSSPWYEDVLAEWQPNIKYIDFIGKKLKRKEFVPAIVVVENEDKYLIVNGHHRYYAHLVAGEKTIKAIVIEGTFEDTEPLRKAEVLLKEYDKKNQYQYQFSGYLDRWAAEAEDARFVNKYRPIIKVDLFSGLKVFLKKVYGKNS